MEMQEDIGYIDEVDLLRNYERKSLHDGQFCSFFRVTSHGVSNLMSSLLTIFDIRYGLLALSYSIDLYRKNLKVCYDVAKKPRTEYLCQT